jgi:hypothetical protein
MSSIISGCCVVSLQQQREQCVQHHQHQTPENSLQAERAERQAAKTRTVVENGRVVVQSVDPTPEE